MDIKWYQIGKISHKYC